MANIKSAKKRILQTLVRTERNRADRSQIRTEIKKVEMAIAANDKTSAEAAFKVAEPALRRGVSKGVVQKNTASRKISRLALKINAL